MVRDVLDMNRNLLLKRHDLHIQIPGKFCGKEAAVPKRRDGRPIDTPDTSTLTPAMIPSCLSPSNFVAPDDVTAAGTGPRYRDHGLPAVVFEGFFPDEAVLEWESLFTGKPINRIAESEPRMVVPMANDGFEVFEVGPPLRTLLAGAGALRLGEIADRWAALESRADDEVSSEEAAGILEAVGALAREAVRAGRGLYCWYFAP